jgi:hypothetical protein
VVPSPPAWQQRLTAFGGKANTPQKQRRQGRKVGLSGHDILKNAQNILNITKM